ncbi:glycosyltransferase family 2 protein [Clostridium perfringens]|uniref:glycosyltransferase family 2 protein n=1 Tax=Clostridium perfringens TaxID=1502 RepID=UPI0022464B82|nr:glycosyltransferase family 2 protein [Clostridium perfringens]MCX0404016.1 glycosyltransferase family 2 protein [Clostridium perfringens]MDK0542035.1 glycosyltransferase family 2 protein [Clostridium perfringens]MDT7981636.1 glycosyltransferase family 2 protein [Clostridium perfringens]
MTKVAAVIVTYNINEKINAVCEAVIRQVDKVIVVDNGSKLETVELLNNLQKQFNKIELILNKENQGISKALNLGVKKALEIGFDFIMTLDHDSILKEDVVSKLLNSYYLMKENKEIGIVSPAIYDINKKDYLGSININEENQFIDEPIQSGSLIKREVFEKIGYFNEELVIYYVDTEFCYRAKKAKFKFLQCNNTCLYHEEGKKSEVRLLGKKIYYQNYSEFAIYYRARNYVYMMKNYYELFSSKDRIIKDFIKILAFDKKRVNSLKAHLKGFYDGIRIFK